jgi:hypothetical protein
LITAGKSHFPKVCCVILSWETFTGKTFLGKTVATFSREISGKLSPEKVSSCFVQTQYFPLGETLCIHYCIRVYNTRLESVFIEKHSILLSKTPGEIFPTGSFPDFPKFSGRNFPDGKFPGFPEILREKFSRREVSRISRNSPGEIFPTELDLRYLAYLTYV